LVDTICKLLQIEDAATNAAHPRAQAGPGTLPIFTACAVSNDTGTHYGTNPNLAKNPIREMKV